MWILLIISSVAPPVAEPLPPGAIARLGSTRWLVGENARGLVASPDGRQVMIGRPVGLRIFDARSGEVAEHLTEPQAYHLTALDWHADKALVRSQTLTEKIWLFDVKRSVGLVGLEVPQACLSNDGQLVHTIVDGAFYSYEIQTQRWSRIGSLGEQPSNREQMLIANPKRRELAVAPGSPHRRPRPAHREVSLAGACP